MSQRSITSRVHHHLSTIQRYRRSSLDLLEARYHVRRVADGDYLEAAKRLHAKVYLDRKFVTEEDIHEDKLSHAVDPYHQTAEYFVAIDKETDEVVALIRQIHQRTGKQLPVFLHGLTKKQYADVHRNDIVELSAFAKARGVDSRVTLLLFREMLKHSDQKGHQYWVFACDKMVYRNLKTLFGPLLQKIGPVSFYMGSDVVPSEVNLDQAMRQLQKGYRRSLPPVRDLRKFLYDVFAASREQGGLEHRRPNTSVFWDQYAKAYDGLLEFAPYQHLIAHVSELALSSQPRAVLDLGCGTGNVAVSLLTRDSTVQVDAVDWSRAMLGSLAKKTNDSRLTIRRRGALEYLRATRRKYDVIVMNNVVYTLSDRTELWQLIAKRLNPGGRIVIANPDTGDSSSLVNDHLQNRSLWSLLKPRLLIVGMFDSVISLLGLSRTYEFASGEDLLKELGGAGFRLEGEMGRCYGGHTRGIDVLFTVKKTGK